MGSVIELPMTSLTRCKDLYGNDVVGDDMLCAGTSYQGRGLCYVRKN